MKPRLLSFFAKNVIILMFGYSTISYAYVIWVYSTSNSRKNVLISIKITFPFWAIRYFSSFFMTNIIRFLQATRDFLKIHICDQTNFLSATLNGWNIVIHTTLLMVLLYKYYIKIYQICKSWNILLPWHISQVGCDIILPLFIAYHSKTTYSHQKLVISRFVSFLY